MTDHAWNSPEARAAARERSRAHQARRREGRRAAAVATVEGRRLAQLLTAAYGDEGAS